MDTRHAQSWDELPAPSRWHLAPPGEPVPPAPESLTRSAWIRMALGATATFLLLAAVLCPPADRIRTVATRLFGAEPALPPGMTDVLDVAALVLIAWPVAFAGRKAVRWSTGVLLGLCVPAFLVLVVGFRTAPGHLAAYLAAYGLLLWLGVPGPEQVAEKAQPRARTPRRSTAFSFWDGTDRFVPPFLLLLVLLAAALPNPTVAAMLAFALALGTAAVLRPPSDPARRPHRSQVAEVFCWLLVSLGPGLVVALRQVTPERAIVLVAVVVAAAPVVVGWYRSRLSRPSRVLPERLLPWALAWGVLALSPSLRTAVGALESLGFQDLPFGEPPEVTTGLPWETALLAWFALRFLLQAWGRGWWPGALLVAAVVALTTPGGAPAWMLWAPLLFAALFLHGRHVRWLATIGPVIVLAFRESPELGATLLAGITLWALIWGWAFGGSRREFAPAFPRALPLVTIAVATLVSALPFLVALQMRGELEAGVLAFVRELLAVKVAPGAGESASPHRVVAFLSVVVGLSAGWDAVRRRQDGPIAGTIILLTFLLLAVLAFEPLPSSTLWLEPLTWPLLGALVVWQFHRRHEPHPAGAARRSTPRQIPTAAHHRSLVLALLVLLALHA